MLSGLKYRQGISDPLLVPARKNLGATTEKMLTLVPLGKTQGFDPKVCVHANVCTLMHTYGCRQGGQEVEGMGRREWSGGSCCVGGRTGRCQISLAARASMVRGDHPLPRAFS